MIISEVIEYNEHYITSEFSNGDKDICVLLVFTKGEPSTIIYEYVGKEQGTNGMMLYGAYLVQLSEAKKFIDNFIKG